MRLDGRARACVRADEDRPGQRARSRPPEGSSHFTGLHHPLGRRPLDSGRRATNALARPLMIPAYPLWSLAIFAIDILAIYGLIDYGQQIGAS